MQKVEPATIKKPTLDLLRSYTASIKNSVGTDLFRQLYFHIGDTSIDVLEDGDLSCATYVTGILYLFDLIQERHTTVVSTIEDMKQSGWYEIEQPRTGAVILWDFKKGDDGTQGKHRHVGFYINDKLAVSNDSATRVVAAHHPTFGTDENGDARRRVLAYYWNDRLI